MIPSVTQDAMLGIAYVRFSSQLKRRLSARDSGGVGSSRVRPLGISWDATAQDQEPNVDRSSQTNEFDDGVLLDEVERVAGIRPAVIRQSLHPRLYTYRQGAPQRKWVQWHTSDGKRAEDTGYYPPEELDLWNEFLRRPLHRRRLHHWPLFSRSSSVSQPTIIACNLPDSPSAVIDRNVETGLEEPVYQATCLPTDIPEPGSPYKKWARAITGVKSEYEEVKASQKPTPSTPVVAPASPSSPSQGVSETPDEVVTRPSEVVTESPAHPTPPIPQEAPSSVPPSARLPLLRLKPPVLPLDRPQKSTGIFVFELVSVAVLVTAIGTWALWKLPKAPTV